MASKHLEKLIDAWQEYPHSTVNSIYAELNDTGTWRSEAARKVRRVATTAIRADRFSAGKNNDANRGSQCEAGSRSVFSVARPRVIKLYRFSWEKATAIHLHCAQGEAGFHGRFSRHLHDLVRLEEAGFIDQAIQRGTSRRR